MNRAVAWRQNAMDVLFVATEAVAWFLALRVFASMLEQAFFSDLEQRLDSAIRAGQVANPARADAVLTMVRTAATEPHGPNLLLVLLVAFGAFYFIRQLDRWRLTGALGAIVLLMGSVVALNIALRIALVGDLRAWDVGGIVDFFANPDPYFAARLDLEAFIANPTLQGAHGGALAVTFAIIAAMWLRFLLAGRAPVNFDRSIRSFGISFFVVLFVLVAARFAGVPAEARFAVLHFVLGVLGLAVANNARAATPTEGAQRTTPWIVSVGATVGILAGVAGVLGLLAALNVGVVLAAIGGFALSIFEVILLIIVTPIFWLLEAVVSRFLPEGIEWPELTDTFQPGEQPEREQGEGVSIPEWITGGLRFLAVIALAYLGYRIALLIVRMRRAAQGPVDEIRSRRAGGAGLGDLLRDLLPRRGRQGPGGAWMQRHRIYRLYGRTVVDSHERGFRMMPGETPLEFSARASRALAAPFEAIGRAFDRARYGRHYPPDDEVRDMEAQVQRWEVETPPTEELRERLRGAPQLSDRSQIELRVEHNRAIARGDEERARRLDLDQ